MSTAEQYRDANLYTDSDGDPIPTLTVTVWDVLVVFLSAVREVAGALTYLAKGHNNLRVERKAVEIEMRAAIESIR